MSDDNLERLVLGRAADRFGPPIGGLTKVSTRALLTYHDRVLGELGKRPGDERRMVRDLGPV